ncbi:FAD:protein FMN transferase [Niveibacterium umoris]|uniref:FAD:protein FMN transferase n=1 Tax=Niveibacterium umoris TaxID=1193620 RepID=A0A840BKU4_9RHOO|nr:FAD:protein FMN transferase [Niveibacterium umoris]MBB4013243.1 thiamine biosynthesis lipoprotein [Niveibacterium umoris]
MTFARSLTLLRLFPLLVAIATLAGCARNTAHHEESFVFGTRVEITTWGVPEAQAGKAVGAVLREFDRMHRAYHGWQPSELTTLNAALARGETATVTPELAGMLVEAKDLAARGDQLFDPAIGKLIGLWGFHRDQYEAVTPDPLALREAVAAHPTMADLEIEGTRVSSRNPAVQLDLGGYAKGWALDRAAEILRAEGIANALINIGGNVLALGAKGEQPWKVGIQNPRGAGALAALPLKDGEAIGTSGDYQRFFERDGQRFCHLIDPRTGNPATETRSLTILVAARPRAGTLSDAASKPAFIDGEHWRARVAAYGIDHALRVDAAGRIAVTRALAKRIEWLGDVRADTVVD